MKLPNGFGSVHKLPGKRRHAWRARKTAGWEIKDGEAHQKYITVGYYSTKQEALQALADYNADPYDLHFNSITLEEVYEKWSDEKFLTISESNCKGYRAAWLLCAPIKDMAFQQIKIDHLQKVMDESGKNAPTLKKFKTMICMMYKYAVIHQIITPDRNFSKYLDFKKAGNPNRRDHHPFTSTEIERLWSVQSTNEYFSVILMLIYSGCRISELLDLKKSDVCLEERYFKVIESKTKAGIRSVPIAKKILPFFEHWMHKNDCEYVISTPDGEKFEYRNYYDSYWTALLKNINLDSHRPHDTRHTCISLLMAAGVEERFIQHIVGHKGQNVTEVVYTHFEIQRLIEEIDKI